MRKYYIWIILLSFIGCKPVYREIENYEIDDVSIEKIEKYIESIKVVVEISALQGGAKFVRIISNSPDGISTVFRHDKCFILQIDDSQVAKEWFLIKHGYLDKHLPQDENNIWVISDFQVLENWRYDFCDDYLIRSMFLGKHPETANEILYLTISK